MCPSAQLVAGPKRRVPPKRKCIPAQDHSTLSDPNIHRSQKKSPTLARKSPQWAKRKNNPPTLRESKNQERNPLRPPPP
ncbi:hypothetical protein VN97_g9444, partial [Penicillium thymicola]